jgi:hypothetical protein
MGTRPKRSTNESGDEWNEDVLAEMCGISKRGLGYWVNDQRRPEEPQWSLLQRALFGANKNDYREHRAELRDAHARPPERKLDPKSSLSTLGIHAPAQCDETDSTLKSAMLGWSQAPIFEKLLEARRKDFERDGLFKEIRWCANEASNKRLILVTGMPGAGKSSVAAQFIQSKPCGPVLAYHCFVHNDDRTRQLDGFVLSIAGMLAMHLASYCEALAQPIPQQALRQLEGPAKDGPSTFFITAIFDQLQSLAPPQGSDAPAWIVLDALDEAVDANDAVGKSEIIYLLTEALRRTPAWLRLLVTSRRDGLAIRLSRQRLVHHISLDDDVRIKSDNAFSRYVDRQLEGHKTLSRNIKSLLIERTKGNFLYLRHVLDEIGVGNFRVEDIDRLPSELSSFYTAQFVRLYPNPGVDEFKTLVKPLLAIFLVARKPLSAEWLCEIFDSASAELIPVLQRLAPFVSENNVNEYSIFHKSFEDWLLNPVEAGQYAISELEGHKRLVGFCMQHLDEQLVRLSHVADSEANDKWHYVVRHGVHHLLAAGKIAQAVRLVGFINKHWNEEEAQASAFISDVHPRHFIRILLRALENCPVSQKREIDPAYLVPLIEDFYQIEPLRAPVTILFRDHSEQFESTLDKCLRADNYVLRYVVSEVLASICTEDDAHISLRQAQDWLDNDDINRRELGAYILRHVYSREPQRIEVKCLEQMGNSDTYPSRSALGDLLLNLALQQPDALPQVQSEVFWKPVWEHNRLDVNDLLATVSAFRQHETQGDREMLAARDSLASTEKLRNKLLKSEEIRSHKQIFSLVNNFRMLGRNPVLIRDAEGELGRSLHLTDLMRLFFSHPLWNVAETAASALADFVTADRAKLPIIDELFNDKYWRVRFGAIETAYILAHVVGMDLFGKAVHYSCADPQSNSRIRALCAENLVSYILERPPNLRKKYLQEFKPEITRWVGDTDCWVLEHIFRLFRALNHDRIDVHEFYPPTIPPLLMGLPDNGWDTLPRIRFLTHIETRRRQQLKQAPP